MSWRGSQSHSTLTTVSHLHLTTRRRRHRKPKNSESLNLHEPQTSCGGCEDTEKVLVFYCPAPENEVGQEEEDDSNISILEVSFQPTTESHWRDTNHTLHTDSLAWALYNHLMDFLADREVDNTLADELIELSTALQHQEYINFLDDLEGFV